MVRRPAADAVQRSFVLVGHRSCGKTSVAEHLIRAAGGVRAAGRVDDGTSLLDHEPLSRSRRATLSTSFSWLSWKDVLLHLMDTPGGAEGSGDRRLCAEMASARVVVVDGVAGLERGAARALKEALRAGAPFAVFINRVDRPNQAEAVIDQIAAVCDRPLVLLNQPLHDPEAAADDAVCAEVDLVAWQVRRFDPEGSGGMSPEPLPSAAAVLAAPAREALVEAVASADDALLESYLENFDLEPDAVRAGLGAAFARAALVPVVVGSGANGLGCHNLLDVLADGAAHLPPSAAAPPSPVNGKAPAWVARSIAHRIDDQGRPYTVLVVVEGALPAQPQLVLSPGGSDARRARKLYRLRGPRRSVAASAEAGAVVAVWDPLPGPAGCWFTDGPVLDVAEPSAPSMAWWEVRCERPANGAPPPKLIEALDAVGRLDPSLRWTPCDDGEAVMLSGTSERQLAVAVARCEAELGCRVRRQLPAVGYIERPVRSVEGVHGLFREPLGDGTEGLGEVWIEVSPLRLEDGFCFEGAVDDDVLPGRFLPAVGEGARRALRAGPRGGYPVHGVLCRCVGGEYDVLGSTDVHFEAAGEAAMRAALEASGTELLEPWCEVAVRVGNEEVGAVITDLSAHRGRVLGLEASDDAHEIRAVLPERELRTLASRLEAIVEDDVDFDAHISHYDRVPDDLVHEATRPTPTHR